MWKLGRSQVIMV